MFVGDVAAGELLVDHALAGVGGIVHGDGAGEQRDEEAEPPAHAGSVARVGARRPARGSCYLCTVSEAWLLFLFGVAAVGWFAVKAGDAPAILRLFRGPPRLLGGVPTTARIADVNVFDEGEGDHMRTLYRFVLLFTTEEGEAIAVDWTYSPSPHEKDILLPDAIVPIRYDPEHPDRFEIEFGRFPRAGEPPLPAPTPPRAQARRVYSPRR